MPVCVVVSQSELLWFGVPLQGAECYNNSNGASYVIINDALPAIPQAKLAQHAARLASIQRAHGMPHTHSRLLGHSFSIFAAKFNPICMPSTAICLLRPLCTCDAFGCCQAAQLPSQCVLLALPMVPPGAPKTPLPSKTTLKLLVLCLPLNAGMMLTCHLNLRCLVVLPVVSARSVPVPTRSACPAKPSPKPLMHSLQAAV
jgi:hypothetical protein